MPARHNLPEELSSLVGREAELAEIRRLLDSTRLLTLTGAGGVGKTRLALRVARDVVAEYEDGAWLVELAGLASPAAVPGAAAAALGVREEPGRPVAETFADALRSRCALLVLDNCEHLAAACAWLVVHLLRGAASLRVLATSREPLGVPGECAWRVPSLAMPEPDEVAPRRLLSSSAARLFFERARAARGELDITERNAPLIARICRQLDGIPLALELAAARTRALSVEQIAERLDDRFRLLGEGFRTAPPRHQTLWAAIDWSYGLLVEPERRLLGCIAAFAGGWTLEAAERVCGSEAPAPDEIARGDVLDLLARLVDRSLVNTEAREGGTRYALLETVRQYALERLRAAGREQVLRNAHLTYFADLARNAEPALVGPDQAIWLDRLDAELDNVRAALAWSAAGADQLDAGLGLASALLRFWIARGHTGEGRRWLGELLAAADRAGAPPPEPVRARALYTAGYLAFYHGDPAAARPLVERALALRRKLGDRTGEGVALVVLGIVVANERDAAGAIQFADEAVALLRDAGDELQLAHALIGRAIVARLLGDTDRAIELLDDCVPKVRRLGDEWRLTQALGNLGLALHHRGDRQRARPLFEESLAIRRSLGDAWGVASSLVDLGELASEAGEADLARAWYAEGLATLRELGYRSGMARVLESFGALLAAQGAEEPALRLAGAAEALRAVAGALSSPPEHARAANWAEAARRRLGMRRAAAAWAAGRESPDETVDEALRVARAAKAPAGRDTLSPREREVVALVAQGLTNREIADRLVISPGTARIHVEHILGKLGLRSRVELAAWAIERGVARSSAT
jgi:non-specific serine/threonine protein kinase